MKDFRGMKRQRSRNRGKPTGGQSNNPNRAYESNGPENSKVRGNAQTIYEKYQQLARDANSSGDRVLAENYLQHAEHYFRMIRLMQPQRPVSEFVQRDPFATSFDDYDDDGELIEAPMDETADAPPSDDNGSDDRQRYDNNRDRGQNRDRNRDRGQNREPNRDRDRDQNRDQNRDRDQPRDQNRESYRDRDQNREPNRDRDPNRDPNREPGRRDRRDQYEQRRQQRLVEQEQSVAPAAPGFIASTEPLNGNGGSKHEPATDIQSELPAFLRAPRQTGPSSLVPQSEDAPAPVKAAPESSAPTEDGAEPAPRRRGRPPRRKSEDAVEA